MENMFKDGNRRTIMESESPPIVTECEDSMEPKQLDEEFVKSDDNHSQKSMDATLDTSGNKLLSPTSSIISQRKLEWDSLADVGYANESDRKTSASSLSTLEKLALKQHYSINDSKHDSHIGTPTAHSTVLNSKDSKCKGRKGLTKKTTKIYRKDVDLVEFNFPQDSDKSVPRAVSLNLTKHISFDVERDKFNTDKETKKYFATEATVTSKNDTCETNLKAVAKLDKDIQTSLKRHIENSGALDSQKHHSAYTSGIPVVISLNTIKRRNRRRKFRAIRNRIKKEKTKNVKENNDPAFEKSGEQLSAAESFEYMPGHLYNASKSLDAQSKCTPIIDNKSSLESSAAGTTDSSKGSKYSFTKDLEKSIEVLKLALQRRYKDSNHKKKLIKEIVQRLLDSRYRDDESSTDFLSGLSFNSKKGDLVYNNYTTSSNSDAANTIDRANMSGPKSILRFDKYNSSALASASQSAPNLPAVSNVIKSVMSEYISPFRNSKSNESIKEKSPKRVFTKTSSEELYRKYINALEKEKLYRKNLMHKEGILKQKLITSDTTLKSPIQAFKKDDSKLEDLLNDLIRNDYDKGSGDASKLNADTNLNQMNPSIFTLTCGCDSHNKSNSKKKTKKESIKLQKAECSKCDHHCCLYHSKTAKIGVTDSSVQVNIKYPCSECRNEQAHVRENEVNSHECHNSKFDKGCIKPSCFCKESLLEPQEEVENFLICKCSCSFSEDKQSENVHPRKLNIYCVQDKKKMKVNKTLNLDMKNIDNSNLKTCGGTNLESDIVSKSSQTNTYLNSAIIQKTLSDGSMASWSSDDRKIRELSLKRDLSGSTINLMNDRSDKLNEVYLCDRLIQTEISINPQISDPSLTDINILNDSECVTVINKDIKKSKICLLNACCSHSQTNYSCKPTFNTDRDWSENVVLSKKYSDINIVNNVAKIVNDNSPISHERNKCEDIPKKMTIPIQGTNMILMVSVGSCDSKIIHKNNVELVNQGVTTDRLPLAEKGTCLMNECTKAVQSENINIFKTDMILQPACLSVNQIGSEKENRDNFKIEKNCSIVNSCLTNNTKFNTYPTCESNKAQKHSLGSCSDRISFLEDNCNQTTKIEKHDLHGVSNICETIVDAGHQTKNISSYEYDDSSKNKQKNANNGKSQVTCETSFSKDQCKPEETSNSICTNNVIETHLEEFYRKQEVNATDQCQLKGSSINTKNVIKTNRNKDEYIPKCTDFIEKHVNKQESREKIADAVADQRLINKTKHENTSITTVKCDASKVCKSKSQKESQVNEFGKPESSSAKSTDTDIGPDLITLTIQNNDVNHGNECIKAIKESFSRSGLENQNRLQTVQKDIQQYYNKLAKSVPKQSKERSCISRSSSVKKISTLMDVCKEQTLTASFTDQNVIEHKIFENMNTHKTENVNLKTLETKKQDESLCTATKSHEIEKNKPENCESIDPILDLIQGITNRYNKRDVEKNKRKKCFRDIMNLLSYLLDTEESTDNDQCKTSKHSSICIDKGEMKKLEEKICKPKLSRTKKLIDKGVGTDSCMKSKNKAAYKNESSDIAISTDIPETSSDSGTCKILNKIKKECDMYHQKRCKSFHSSPKKCEISSSTSANCGRCNYGHHCPCKSHRCKGYRAKPTVEKVKKKCIAYNLIIQSSDSVINEEKKDSKKSQHLKNVIVKIPAERKNLQSLPFREVSAKLEKGLINEPCNSKTHRSKSCHDESEISSVDEFNRPTQIFTLREYLERNRPDFVDQTLKRRDCLKLVNEFRANERAAQRKLLSLQLERLSTLSEVNETEVRRLATEIGLDLRRKIEPKFISEREMKKHSEKIYKSLPEVKQKKEDIKKERIKKSNILMANIFKKNLQKKTLRGAVNLSNYSKVIKI